MNKPAAQAVGANPSRCNSTNAIGKIHPSSKSVVTFEPILLLWYLSVPLGEGLVLVNVSVGEGLVLVYGAVGEVRVLVSGALVEGLVLVSGAVGEGMVLLSRTRVELLTRGCSWF